jgi:ATP-dependent Lhr-like helicase
VDIWQNLERPLAEIARTAAELGMTAPSIAVAVRTGDTAAAERAAMLKKPPDFLITTPESLYLLLTAERPRAMLRAVRTVIVDEIHAVAGNKRGSHLALTLERLAHVAADPVQRIGLSATPPPIEARARLVVGAARLVGRRRRAAVLDRRRGPPPSSICAWSCPSMCSAPWLRPGRWPRYLT